jgi:hypothetical protein
VSKHNWETVSVTTKTPQGGIVGLRTQKCAKCDMQRKETRDLSPCRTTVANKKSWLYLMGRYWMTGFTSAPECPAKPGDKKRMVEVWLAVEVFADGQAYCHERDDAQAVPTDKERKDFCIGYQGPADHVVWVNATVPVPEIPADVVGHEVP